MGDVHGRVGWDVDGGYVDRTAYADRVMEADGGGDVDSVGGDVHLGGNGDGVADDATVHGRSVGCARSSDWCDGVAHVVRVWGQKVDTFKFRISKICSHK